MTTKIGDAKISNSHRGFRFSINKRDIENGQPNDPCSCAAALALKRHTGAKEVRVYRDVTYIDKGGSPLRYHTSKPLRLETIIFDRNGEFFPGEYDLEPMPVHKISKRSNGKASASAPKRRGSNRGRYTIPNVRPTASQRLGG